MSKRLLAIILSSSLMLLGTGCVPGPASGDIVPEIPVPDRFDTEPSDAAGDDLDSETSWVDRFGDASFAASLRKASTGNPAVEKSLALLDEALASSDMAVASLGPSADLSGSWSHDRSGRTGTTSFKASEVHRAAVSGSWTPDIWGGLAASSGQADATAMAAALDVVTARETAMEDAAVSWVDMAAAGKSGDLWREVADTRRTEYDCADRRFASGDGTRAQRDEARDQVAAAERETDLAGLSFLSAKRSLAAACGQSSWDGPVPSGLPENLPAPPSISPAGVLLRRADVMAAAKRVEAASLGVQVARVDRLPSVTLSPTAALSGAMLASVLDNWALSLVSEIRMTLFDGGAGEASVKAATARLDQAVADYKETFLSAYKDASEALSLDREAWLSRQESRDALRLAEDGYALAVKALRDGSGTFPDVLDAREEVLLARIDDLSAASGMVKARVATFMALGGTFKTENGEVNE